ncbi:MAG: hypothetical protein QM692_14720, partial [Thermomicrobiales bacterium]
MPPATIPAALDAEPAASEASHQEPSPAVRPSPRARWRALAHPKARLALTALLALWAFVIAGAGVTLALRMLGGSHPTYIWPDIATPKGFAGAALVILSCLAVAVLMRWRWPAAVLPVTLSAGAAWVLVCAIATSTVGAVASVAGIGLWALFIGGMLLAWLPGAGAPPLTLAPVALTLGLGVLGLLGFGLGTFGVLGTPGMLAGGGALTAGLAVALLATHRRPGWARRRGWRPPLSWFETLVVGLTVGQVAFACLIALVPETISDAVWQQLPIVREIWQTGTVAEFAHLEVSKDPIQAHVLYAIACMPLAACNPPRPYAIA